MLVWGMANLVTSTRVQFLAGIHSSQLRKVKSSGQTKNGEYLGSNTTQPKDLGAIMDHKVNVTLSQKI